MKSIVDMINSNSWADWSVSSFTIDYERILINLSAGVEDAVIICCKDYIGFYYVGHWDESIIEDVSVEHRGSLIDESIQSVKKFYGDNPLPGGGIKKINDNWHQLNIKLIDGNIIKVACKEIQVDEI